MTFIISISQIRLYLTCIFLCAEIIVSQKSSHLLSLLSRMPCANWSCEITMNSSIKVLKMHHEDKEMPQSVLSCGKDLFKHYWWQLKSGEKKRKKETTQTKKTACLQCLIIWGSWFQHRFLDISLHSKALMLYFFLPVSVEFPTLSPVSGGAVENVLFQNLLHCAEEAKQFCQRRPHRHALAHTLKLALFPFILSLLSL